MNAIMCVLGACVQSFIVSQLRSSCALVRAGGADFSGGGGGIDSSLDSKSPSESSSAQITCQSNHVHRCHQTHYPNRCNTPQSPEIQIITTLAVTIIYIAVTTTITSDIATNSRPLLPYSHHHYRQG